MNQYMVGETPLAERTVVSELIEQWAEAQRLGKKSDLDIYGKPTDEQLRELEKIRSLSKELQENIHDLESAVRIADVENEAMNPTAPILDYGEDHEFVPANEADGYYAQAEKVDPKVAEKQLTKGNADKTDIQRFYKDQCVFLTGGTGFLGKVLIEKLLRACGDFDTIYVLVREKKGKEAHARIRESLDDFLYKKALAVNPKGAQRVVPIIGDMQLPGLGISLEDRKMLTSKITIVINAAATVKFDEKLPMATAINVRGTKEVLKLAKECRHLKAITHVSTAYSHTYQKDIEEKFYEPPISVKALEAVSQIDENILESITQKILGKHPNTYCFTKAVAEEAVRQCGEGLPICIIRPSIVISTYEEPVRSWTDSLYGPTGLMIGIGTGVIRTMYLDREKVADMVPVDYVVNAIIASTYHTAKNFKENQTSEIPIYNYVSGARNPIKWGEFINLNKKYGIDKPTTKAVWYYGLNPTASFFMFTFYNFFLHFLPALAIDTFCSLTGRKTGMMNFYNKMMRLTHILFYFSMQEWNFSDNNVEGMWSSLSPADKTLFPFNIADMSWEYLLETFLVGLRVYLVKDEMSTLPEAKKRWNRLYYMHQMLKVIIFGLLLNLLYIILKYTIL